MRYLKMSALAAVAVGALMAFVGAGSASATELCSTTTTTCPAAQRVSTFLVFTSSPGTSLLLKETGAEGGVLDTCKSSEIEDEITNSGSSTTTPTWGVSKHTWSSCTLPTTTIVKGKEEIHKIAGTSNGTLTSDEPTKMTINTIFFGTCVYGADAEKSLGDFTEGNPAIVHTNTVTRKKEGSNSACPETAIWSSTYTLKSPATTISVAEG